ncbi:MAG: hypothetical protein J4428_01695 [Candidatus Aenigmarchaeota archaeon]|nr:hypothetical protein [Candidatus Aenigmarchaeota archaeon]
MNQANAWINCNSLLYNNVIKKVRITCNDDTGIQKGTFALQNLNDSYTYFSSGDVTTKEGSAIVYDNNDVTIIDSGSWSASGTCYDSLGNSASQTILWNVPFGYYETYLNMNLVNNTILASRYANFSISYGIKCVQGECGHTQLDLQASSDPSSLPYYILSTDPQTCTALKAGDACNRTWDLNATGAKDNVSSTYAAVGPTQYSFVASNQTPSVDVKITTPGKLILTVNSPHVENSTYMYSPATTFNFSFSIKCMGGDCGDVNLTLDPTELKESILSMSGQFINNTRFRLMSSMYRMERQMSSASFKILPSTPIPVLFASFNFLLTADFVASFSNNTNFRLISSLNLQMKEYNKIQTAVPVNATRKQKFYYFASGGLARGGGFKLVSHLYKLEYTIKSSQFKISLNDYSPSFAQPAANYLLSDEFSGGLSNGTNKKLISSFNRFPLKVAKLSWATISTIPAVEHYKVNETLIDGVSNNSNYKVHSSIGKLSNGWKNSTNYKVFSGAYELLHKPVKNGAISTTVGAKPFYTFNSNPQICLGMKDGDTCNATWTVNTTGEMKTTHTFFGVAASPLVGVVQNTTGNVYIKIDESGFLGDLQCEIAASGNWTSCQNLTYGQTLLKTRARCDSSYNIVNMTMYLDNIDDKKTLTKSVANTTTGGYWIFVNNHQLTDSGTMNLTASCGFSNKKQNTTSVSWNVPFGKLTTIMVAPFTSGATVDVTKRKFFNYSFIVSCTDGECGDVKLYADPYPGDTSISSTFKVTEQREEGQGNTSSFKSSSTNFKLASNLNEVMIKDLTVGKAERITAGYKHTYVMSGNESTSNTYMLTSVFGELAGRSTLSYEDPANLTIITTKKFYSGYVDVRPTPKAFVDYGKGIISTVAGAKPFYTTNLNPQACLNMSGGEVCYKSWQVNATGDVTSTHKFYGLVEGSTYWKNITSMRTDTTTVIIQEPSNITALECEINSTGRWERCQNLTYSSTLLRTRVLCPSYVNVTSMSMKLQNVEDNALLNSASNTSVGADNYWLVANNYQITDSGTMNLTVSCYVNNALHSSRTVKWFIPFGTLKPIMISPYTENATNYVEKDEMFSFSFGVRCVGGECGNVNLTADPESSTTSPSYKVKSSFNNVLSNSSSFKVTTSVSEVMNGEFTTPRQYPFKLRSSFSGGISNNTNFKTISFNDLDPSEKVYGNKTVKPTMSDSYGLISVMSDGGKPISKNYGIGVSTFMSPLAGVLKLPNGTTLIHYVSYADISGAVERKGIISTRTSATPFYTTNANPQFCTNLKAGDTCNKTWQVNATGLANSRHEFFGIITPTKYKTTKISEGNITVTNSNKTTIIIKALRMDLSFSDSVVFRNDSYVPNSTTINILVKDGPPIENAKVNMSIDSVYVPIMYTNSTGHASYVYNPSNTTTPKSVLVNAIVTFTDRSDVLIKNNTIDVRGVLLTQIDSPAENTKLIRGSSYWLNSTISDERGQAVTVNVTWYTNGTQQATNEDVLWYIPFTQASGNNTLNITATKVYHQTGSSTIQVQIWDSPSILEFANASLVPKGHWARLTAKLILPNNTGLNSKNVTFFLNDTYVGSVFTNTTGGAYLELDTTPYLGLYSVNMSYAGEQDKFLGAVFNKSLTVNITDLSSPVVTLSSPATQLNTTDNTPDFTFTAADNFDTSMSCTLYLDGVTKASSSTVANNTLTTLTSSALADGA